MMWSELKELVERELKSNDLDDVVIHYIDTCHYPDQSHPSTEVEVHIYKDGREKVLAIN